MWVHLHATINILLYSHQAEPRPHFDIKFLWVHDIHDIHMSQTSQKNQNIRFLCPDK